MTSSLASQLAHIGTVDRQRLQAATSKFRPSFLFPPRQAASLSNEDIHSLGYNGFLALLAQDSRFDSFDGPIFGEKAKVTDRGLLSKEENAKLDTSLNSLIRLLASRFLLKSAGKVLEWLVRRFRINEFNVEELLRAILPYHETPQFVQMLQIIDLNRDSKFSAFQAVKESLVPMPRHHLLTAMTKSHELFRFVATSVQLYRQDGCLYSTLTAFWAGAVIAYIGRVTMIQPQDMAVLLPVLIQGLKSGDRDLRMGSCIILGHLATRVELSAETVTLLAESALVGRKNDTNKEEYEAIFTALAILCESYADALSPFSQDAVQLSSVAFEALADIAERSNISALLQPVIGAVLAKSLADSDAALPLSDLLSSPSCPVQITETASRQLLDYCVRDNDIPPVYAAMLSNVQQRLPSKVALSSLASEPTNPRLATVLANLTVPGRSENSDSIAGSFLQRHDPTVRAELLRTRLQNVNATLAVDADLSSEVADFLLECLGDPNAKIATILLAEENWPLLSKLSAQRPSDVLRYVSQETLDSKIIHLRANFILSLSCDALPALWPTQATTQFFWPHLLASKRTRAAHATVRSVITSLGNTNWPLLQSIGELADLGKEGTQMFMRIPLALSEASNKLDTESLAFFKTFLINTSDVSNRETFSNLSTLVLAQMVAAGRIEHIKYLVETRRCKLAKGAMSLIGTQSLTEEVTQLLWSKPTSRTTRQAVDSVLFCTVLHLVAIRPPQHRWTWLVQQADRTAQDHEHEYLVLQAYKLCHVPQIAAGFRSALVHALLTVQLREDAMAFFAMVYTSPKLRNFHRVALQDATAFVRANRATDFQIILPSIVFTLMNGNSSICEAAVDLLQALKGAAPVESSCQPYGFDQFYGTSSHKLQYLSAAQYSHMLSVLSDSKEGLCLDGKYIREVLPSVLESEDAQGRSVPKQAFLSYFISHIEAWHDLEIRTALLLAIQPILDSKRSTLLLPLMLEAAQPISQQSSASTGSADTYYKVLWQGYRCRHVSNEAVQALLQILNSERKDDAALALRSATRASLKDRLLSLMSPDQRIQLCENALGLAKHLSMREASENRDVIRACLKDSATLQGMLSLTSDALQQSSTAVQANKRAKTSQDLAYGPQLGRLALVLENADIASMPASRDLLASLVGFLATLVELHATSQTNVDYYVQLVATRASQVATKFSESASELDIRVGPIMETIRISGNPSTSNAALNLMSDMARLAPSQVAQTVMPIFTFMGTNILQRDDAQSTRVVEKTIQTIVLALVQQHRQRAVTNEQIVSEMEEVLRVFVDAAGHVPRHRREHLFVRFVEVLGAETFLGPVCSLMVDKVALKLVKLRDMSLISLPLALFQHFDGLTQLRAIHAQLVELLHKTTVINTDQPDGSISSRQSSPSTQAESPLLPVKCSRRTVLALLIFLQEASASHKIPSAVQRARAVSPADVESELQSIVKACASLMIFKPQKLTQADLLHISAGSQAVIRSCSTLTNSQEFANIIQDLICHQANQITDLGFEMLSDRLQAVKSGNRRLLTSALATSLDLLSSRIASSDNKTLRLRALVQIRSLAAHCVAEEIPNLFRAFTSVLGAAEKSTSGTFNYQALALAPEVIPRFGGRIIPLVHRLLLLVDKLVEQSLQEITSSINRHTVSTGFAVLDTLLQSSPTFVAKEIKTVLRLCVQVQAAVAGVSNKESASTASAAATKTVSACTKNVPAQALHQALHDLYGQYIASKPQLAAPVVSILGLTIRHTSTRLAADIHKSVFAQILQALDIRSVPHVAAEIATDVEKQAINAFMQLVLKLNEASFRPLFMRLVDWTAVENGPRRLTFYKVLDRMLVQLKGIAVPYFGLALDLTMETLLGNPDEATWYAIVSSLRRSLETDDTGFWTESRLNKVVEPVAAQPGRNVLAQSSNLHAYQSTVKAFTLKALQHYSVLQALHQALLRRAREDDSSTQIAAVQALQAMWNTEAQAELLSLKPESMPVLAELLEMGGTVEQETKQLLAIMAEGEEDAEMAMEEDDSDLSDEGTDGEDD